MAAPSHDASGDSLGDGPEVDLPSLTALTAFDAALRHQSFTGAAKELGRTQGAVSRQVALLESHVGRELFHREVRSLRPTRAAERFGVRVTRLLAGLRSAVAEASGDAELGGVLHLSLLPTFGTTWLIPRLPEFLGSHEGISVELTTSLAAFDFDRSEIDAALHYGEGVWPGARAELLMEEEVVCVAAPGLAESVPEPSALEGRTLLQLMSRPKAWRRWLRAQGAPGIDGKSGPRFEHHMMVVEAARSGLGFALLPDFVAEKPIADGSLVPAFGGLTYGTGKSYWLTYPDRSLELPALVAFRGWLRDEIRAWKSSRA